MFAETLTALMSDGAGKCFPEAIFSGYEELKKSVVVASNFWRRFMRKISEWLWLFLLVCASGACFAQSTNSGDIRGSVTDSTGALIPGVKVTVLNVDTAVS